ncbi:hypothetical protein, partial [Campylobacter lari]|uniref:hypothetical protein n=1 Tax=Campylobacter lari TaxID=201 RepID=UPI001A9E2A4D
YPKITSRGGGYDNFRFNSNTLNPLKNYKNFNLLKLSLLTILSLNSLEAATQANYDKASNTYVIKKHHYNNNDVYDYNLD